MCSLSDRCVSIGEHDSADRCVSIGEHDSAVLVSARSSTPGIGRLPIDPSLSISKAYAR